jgi:hypothetical protein
MLTTITQEHLEVSLIRAQEALAYETDSMMRHMLCEVVKSIRTDLKNGFYVRKEI